MVLSRLLFGGLRVWCLTVNLELSLDMETLFSISDDCHAVSTFVYLMSSQMLDQTLRF